MTNIIITGYKGRMGQTLITCAARHSDLRVAGKIDFGADLASVIGQGDVVIDFSSHEATAAFVKICAEHKKPIVIGTTGHDEAEKAAIAKAAKKIPIVLASNY